MADPRVTIERSENRAIINGMRTRNNGRYNGNGREWATPPEVFEPLHEEFAFTVDACATAHNAKLPRFWSEADNGLEQDWRGERVFSQSALRPRDFTRGREKRVHLGLWSSGCCRPLQTSRGGTRTWLLLGPKFDICAGACGFSPMDRIGRAGSSRR